MMYERSKLAEQGNTNAVLNKEKSFSSRRFLIAHGSVMLFDLWSELD
jgi:hypothetical protein